MDDPIQNPQAAALRRTDWLGAIDETATPIEIMSRLTALASSLDESDSVAAAAVRTLEQVCSFWPKSGDWGEPYVPMMQLEGGRTALPNDLQQDQLEMLRTIVVDVSNLHLRGRIFDVLWLRWPEQAMRHQFARAAVEAWSEVPLSDDSWDRGQQDELDRALMIAKRLRFEDLEKRIVESLRTLMHNSQSVSMIVRLSVFLRDRGLGNESSGSVLSELGRALTMPSPSTALSRSLFMSLSRWQVLSGDEAGAIQSLKSVADLWIADAEARTVGDNASYLVAADFLESALQQLRQIPRRSRTAEVLNLLKELPGRIREFGLRGLEEMQLFESEPVDISQMIDNSRLSVSGKSALDALASLASFPLASFNKDRAAAEELNSGSISGLFGNAHYSGDGRRTNKSASDGIDRYGVPAATWRQMITSYEIRIELATKGFIWPVLESISTTHLLQEADFMNLVTESGFVPPGNRELYAKGLCDGYYSNFPSALHILTPQLESVIRFHMREAGVATSAIDKEGNESEIGLSKLLEAEGVDELLGPDLAYEIRALFCGPIGPNLRNVVAHGLVAPSQAYGIQSLYVWWICFRLAYVPYFNRLRAAEPPSPADGPAE